LDFDSVVGRSCCFKKCFEGSDETMIIEDRFDVIENPNSYHIADLYSSLVLIFSNYEEIFLFPY
jgi:hypothetical protein